MKGRAHRRGGLSYANVMSTLCFFLLVSGGAAYAVDTLDKGSVGAKQLKKNAVTTAKIKNGAVTAAKVRRGTLTGAQIEVSTLGTVPRALDAQTLGGRSATQISEASRVSCPAGTTSVVGVCFESSARPAKPLFEAMLECAKGDRRLPTMGELIAFGLRAFTSAPPYEWAEPEEKTSGALEGAVVAAWAPGEFLLNFEEASNPNAYRCVTTASN